MAGRLLGVASSAAPPTLEPLPPPPDSWASDPQADLGIYTLAISAGARFGASVNSSF